MQNPNVKLFKLLLPLFFLCLPAITWAQANISEDTAAILVTSSKRHPGDTLGYMILTKGQRISCLMHDSTRIEGNLCDFTTTTIMLDSVNYQLDSITSISTLTKTRKAMLIIGGVIIAASTMMILPVELAAFSVTGLALGNLLALSGISRTSTNPRSLQMMSRRDFFSSPPYLRLHRSKHGISGMHYGRCVMLFDSAYQYRSSQNHATPYPWLNDSNILVRRHLEFAKKHSISLSVFDLLANQLSISYGYRFSRKFGIEISPGLYFQTSKSSPVVPFAPYENLKPGFCYQPNHFTGYELRLTMKAYSPKRPNRYFGAECLFRNIAYSQKEVRLDVGDVASNLTAVVGLQSEKSNTISILMKLGWQSVAGKLLAMDFYIGLGAAYRGGMITKYHYAFGNGDPQINYAYHLGALLPCVQIGMKMGLRFGKPG